MEELKQGLEYKQPRRLKCDRRGFPPALQIEEEEEEEEEEPDALLIFTLLSNYTSTCFGPTSSPSTGGNHV
jgi:hypothetical protein